MFFVDSSVNKTSVYLYLAFALGIFGMVTAGILLEEWLFFGVPAALLLFFQTLLDFRRIFILLLICIPFSTEFYFPNGFGTDLPTEPLMVGLMGVYLIYVFRHPDKIDGQFLRHPFTLLLILHLGWMLVATVNSGMPFVSIKFFLAKFWYVIVFFFLGSMLLRQERDMKVLFWAVFIPLLITVLISLVRQALNGFAFEHIHASMQPFYRNHVTYGALLSLFMPFLWFARFWYPRRSKTWWFLLISVGIFLIAIQLSYTRAAYVALVIALVAYGIIRLRLMRWAIGGALVVLILGITYLAQDNNYLGFSPDYERTVTHYEFNDLLEATYKFEDISTMERVYRWVAAARMVQDRPLIGYGPGNFYNFYHSYTVTSFETYVSDNPEKSGIHSYYLMMLTDQGFPGLLIFLILTIVILIKGERIYHQTTVPWRKRVVLMVLLSIIVIDAFKLINDLLETDKVGTFYFMGIAILINIDLANRRDQKNGVIP